MMAAAHGEPVMWVNTQTDLSSGPWSEANMQVWNKALVQAAKQYPNMRIFNWAGMVQPWVAPERWDPLHVGGLRDPRRGHRAGTHPCLPGRRPQRRRAR